MLVHGHGGVYLWKESPLPSLHKIQGVFLFRFGFFSCLVKYRLAKDRLFPAASLQEKSELSRNERSAPEASYQSM